MEFCVEICQGRQSNLGYIAVRWNLSNGSWTLATAKTLPWLSMMVAKVHLPLLRFNVLLDGQYYLAGRQKCLHKIWMRSMDRKTTLLYQPCPLLWAELGC